MGDTGDLPAAPPSKSTNLFMQIVERPDGTITRPFVPTSPAVSDPSAGSVAALSKDVPLDAETGTSLRVYLPTVAAPPSHGQANAKLPIILYFHGGGFVLFSSATAFYHASCEAMSASVPAIVVSLDYRLAPEHRLPAAYDDAVAALLWLRGQALNRAASDPWLAAHGDFSRCFVMGSSSGANMAYHVGLRARSLEMHPVKLLGLLLHQPYFGGNDRTPSEAKSDDDFMLPLEANDMLWRLALPGGADRDHEFCNPMVAAPAAARPEGLVRCLVTGCDGDPLVDRQRRFAKWLQGHGVEVVAKLDDVGFHAIELFVPDKAEKLFAEVREFVYRDA